MDSDFIEKALTRIVELLEKQEARYEATVLKDFDIVSDLIDGVAVMGILKIERSTLFRLKASKRLHAVRIGKKDYYSRREIESLVNHFMK